MVRAGWLLAGMVLIAVMIGVYLSPRDAVAAADKGGITVGNQVKVYFRGDAAGQAVSSYVASVSSNASLSGTVKSIDDQWLVLASKDKTLHIPRSVVLMVESGN